MEGKLTESEFLGLANSPEILAAIVESSDDAIIGESLDGMILSWNKGAQSMFGYTAGEAIGKPVSLVIPDPRLAEMDHILEMIRKGDRVRHFETERRRKDGSIIQVSLSISPILDGSGKVIGASKIARDISDVKEARADLAVVRNHLAAIVESSDDAIISKDLSGTITSWNQAAESMFGYTSEEAVGQSIALIIPEERIDSMTTILSRISQGLRVEHFETKRVTKDGRLLDITLSVSPIRNEYGDIVGAAKIARNFTAERRAQHQLQVLYEAGRALGTTLDRQTIYARMQELVAQVMDCDGLIVSSYDPADNLIRARFVWVEGELPDAATFPPIPLAPEGKGLTSRVIRTGEPMVVNDLIEALKNSNRNYRINPDGTIDDQPDPAKPQNKSMLLVPIKLESEVIGIVQVTSHEQNAYTEEDLGLLEGLVFQMAAAAKNAELYQRVTDSEERFRMMANAMPQIAWSLDASGKLDFLNQRFCEYSGNGPETDPEVAWATIVHPDDREASMSNYRRCVEAGKVWEQELRLRRKDGEYRWHLSRLVPVREDGRILKWFGTGTDIHEKIEAEELARREGEALRASREELRSLNAELEHRVEERTAALKAATQEMEGFTYSVSHDLRAPLRSIMSSSMIVLEDFADQVPEEALTHLRRQAIAAKKLSSIIDDLLQYSRLGRKAIEPTRVSLSDTAQSVAAEISKRDPDRPIEWRIQPGLETRGDPNLLTMLLQNLFDNAAKFSAGRDPAITEFGKDDKGFFVRDNGVGFDMRYVDKLFRPFERLHRESDYAGTGIGLANVKRIVERHGGKIWAESEPDRGTTFWFTLPDSPSV